MKVARRRAVVGGIIFIALGVMFLLEALEVFELSPSTLWPVLLLSLGIGVLASIGGEEEDEQNIGIR